MDKLIPITNKIQDAFTMMGTESPIDLPQIAVVGSQSAGKSSVLETIVGTSFLPRGSGIVTRRPCIINLNHTAAGSQEYGTFLHSPDRKFPMGQIAAEIDADTARVCGNNKGLDPRPINLRIFSPNVINLTLIDLPGATRVAVGDQPSDIGKQIEEMLLSYIEKPNCIILAVSAANTDLANSDAILMSRRVDPEGERTLGVLTKLDLMDRGTDARGVFTGENQDVPKLKLGYVGVVNRSQADINENKTIQQARSTEMSYFGSHPAYRSLKDVMGTEYLVEKCSELLIQAIIKALPKISQELNDLINEKKELLKSLPETDPDRLRMTLIEMIVEFTEVFKHMIDGKSSGALAMQAGDLPTKEDGLTGGSRIEAIFRTIFEAELSAIEGDRIEEKDVQALLYNIKGLGGGLFTPDEVLHSMIRKQVEMIEAPSLKSCQLVYNELLGIVQQSIARVSRMEGFPNLVTALQGIVSGIIAKQFEAAQDQIKCLIKMELFRINLNHPDFVGRRGVAALLTEEQTAQELSEVATLPAGQGDPDLLAPADPNATDSIRMSRRSRVVQDPAVGNAQRAIVLMQKQQSGAFLTNAEQRELQAILNPSAAPPAAPKISAPPPSEQRPPRPGRPRSNSNRNSSRNMMAPNKLSNTVDEKLNRVLQRLSDNERVEIDMLLKLTQNYFDIVKKNQMDLVPKAISLMLVGASVESITTELICELTEDDRIDDLLCVSDSTAAKREELTKGLQLLEEANHVLMNDVVKAASFGLGGGAKD